MNFKELEEKRAELQDKMDSILANAKDEKRAMSEEEAAEFDAAEKEIKNIDATLAAEKRAEELKITKEEEPVEEKRAQGAEAVEVVEERAFEAFLRDNIDELRANEQQLTEGNNGAIVPTTIADKIIAKVRDMVPYLTIADVYNTNGKLSVPVYSEDSTNYINADYVDEGSSLVDNIGEFTSIDLTGFVIGALALVSNKLISNTEISITDFVVQKVAEAIAEKLETEFTIGTASKITGVISAPVRKTAAAVNAITYDELVSLKHSIKKRFRKNAKWIMNDSTYEAICKLKDGRQQPYFKDDEYKILGCEVLISDSMASMAASAKPIVFGDLSGYTVKMTKAVEVKVLRERFAERNMIGVIGYGEYDGKVTDAKKLGVLQMAASN